MPRTSRINAGTTSLRLGCMFIGTPLKGVDGSVRYLSRGVSNKGAMERLKLLARRGAQAQGVQPVDKGVEAKPKPAAKSIDAQSRPGSGRSPGETSINRRYV